MPRLKVLFLTEWYPSPERPLAGVFVRAHAEAVRLYDDVRVIHVVVGDRAARAPRVEPVTDAGLTHGIPTYRVPGLLHPRWLPVAYPGRVWAAVQACRGFARAGFRPDVIHAHVYSMGLPALLAGRLLGAPVVVTEHASDFARRTLSPTARLIARAAFAGADRVLPVSRFLQEAITSYGMRARFEVVPNAVDTDFFSSSSVPQDRDVCKHLLFIGTLDNAHRKGLPDLLSALVAVRRRREDWQLDVVGAGPAEQVYERMAGELGLGGKVVFYGALDREGVRKRLAACTCLVSSSPVETFGVVLVEALAAGRPVIATDSGGPAEIVSPDTGLLIPPGNSEALCGAILNMLDRAAEYRPERLSAYARERYGYHAVGQMLDTVYRKVLAER